MQISSDPTLTKSRTRVRIKNETAECVLTTANPGEASNYLTFVDSGLDLDTHRWKKNDGEGWVVSYLNELAAPLLGVTAVREAHGNLAAAELASAVCAEKKASRRLLNRPAKSKSPQPSTICLPPETSRKTQSQSTRRQKPGPSSTRSRAEPHFAHLAMCEVSENGKAPIVPPLGWVLSKPMREKFTHIIEDCGNRPELDQLEAVLN